MFKLLRDEIGRLNLTKKELKVITRERGVKDYENHSKSRLIKEINKLKPSEGPKKTGFEKILSEGYAKKDELKRKEKKKRSVEFKHNIKKIVNSLLLSEKEKIKKIKKLISITKKESKKIPEIKKKLLTVYY